MDFFMRTPVFTLCHVFSHKMWWKKTWKHSRMRCMLCTPSRHLQWISSTVNERHLQRRKKMKNSGFRNFKSVSDNELYITCEKSDKEMSFPVLARSPFLECVTIKFLDNEQCGILRTLPHSLPCLMSRGSATHPICHSATRMKKTTKNLANISTQSLDQFWNLDDMFLRICILVFVGLDTAVGSASGNRLIACTGDFSKRLRLCNHLEEPLVHWMLDHSTVKSNVICIDRAPLPQPLKYDLLELSHPFLCT